MPDDETDVTVILSASVGAAVMPQAYWAQVAIGDEAHDRARIVSAGTMLKSSTNGGLRIIAKPAGTGDKWCVVSLLAATFQLIRGVTVATVGPSDPTFQITGVVPLEQNAIKPLTDPLLVANVPSLDLSAGAAVYAAYRKNAATGADWEALPVGDITVSPPSPPLRAFELVERKYLSEDAATVRWLDFDNNMVGEPETIFDSQNVFAGRANTYPDSGPAHHGSRGLAIEREDLGGTRTGRLTDRDDDDTAVLLMQPGHKIETGNTVNVSWTDGGGGVRSGMTVGTVAGASVPVDGGTGDPLPANDTPVTVANLDEEIASEPIWEIVAMEGFAEWIKAEIYEVESGEDAGWHARYLADATKENTEWQRQPPTVESEDVGFENDTDIYTPVDGDKVLMQLEDPDTDPPTYRVYSAKGKDRFVSSGPSDTAPATLIGKLDNVTTYDDETDRLVEFEEFDDSGTRKVRGYLNVSDLGGGGGGWADGCGIVTTGGTTLNVDVDDIIDTAKGLKKVTVSSCEAIAVNLCEDGGLEFESSGETAGCLKVNICEILRNLPGYSATGTFALVIQNDVCKLIEVTLNECDEEEE